MTFRQNRLQQLNGNNNGFQLSLDNFHRIVHIDYCSMTIE